MYYSNEPAMGSGREKIIDLFCLKHKKHNKLAPSWDSLLKFKKKCIQNET